MSAQSIMAEIGFFYVSSCFGVCRYNSWGVAEKAVVIVAAFSAVAIQERCY